MCAAAAAAAATAGYNPCPGSNPQAITCRGGALIRSPNPHSDNTPNDNDFRDHGRITILRPFNDHPDNLIEKMGPPPS